MALLKSPGMPATLAWATAGLIALYLSFNRLSDFRFRALANIILFITMLKGLVYDAGSLNVAASYSSIKAGVHDTTSLASLSDFSFGLIAGDSILIILITAIYYAASRMMSIDPRTRDIFQAYGLVLFSFLVSALLFSIFGLLDNFQIILTVFWCSSSILFIILGITAGRKIFRQFGLVLLVASAAKIGLIDLWVLGFYNMIYPLFITGSVLIAVSFLYQKNKEKLSERNAEKPVEISVSD
jgi:hypothetical protein